MSWVRAQDVPQPEIARSTTSGEVEDSGATCGVCCLIWQHRAVHNRRWLCLGSYILRCSDALILWPGLRGPYAQADITPRGCAGGLPDALLPALVEAPNAGGGGSRQWRKQRGAIRSCGSVIAEAARAIRSRGLLGRAALGRRQLQGAPRVPRGILFFVVRASVKCRYLSLMRSNVIIQFVIGT